MRKKKISSEVSKELENTVEEALNKLNPIEQLLSEGVKVSKEKKNNDVLPCKGNSHIIATVDWDIDDDTVLPSNVEIPDSILKDEYNSETISDWLSDTVGYCHKGFSLSWPDHHKDHDEFCQWEIEKAHLEGKSEPDFDYRNFYQQGDKVYLVRYYDKIKIKEVLYLTLRTIYPRSMVGVIDKQCCQCMSISDRDNIFYNHIDAMNYFNSIEADVTDEYNEDTGKKKRKRKKAEEDEDITDYEYYDESESEDNIESEE